MGAVAAAKAYEALAGSDTTKQIAASVQNYETQWYTETLPTLIASMQLAIEFDTFGPGLTRVEHPTEAIWNNTHHVWFTELTGEGSKGFPGSS